MERYSGTIVLVSILLLGAAGCGTVSRTVSRWAQPAVEEPRAPNSQYPAEAYAARHPDLGPSRARPPHVPPLAIPRETGRVVKLRPASSARVEIAAPTPPRKSETDVQPVAARLSHSADGSVVGADARFELADRFADPPDDPSEPQAAGGELPALIAGLRDADIERVCRIAHRLGTLGPAARPAATELRRLLAHPDGHVRLQAALALHRLGVGAGPAVPVILDQMQSKDVAARAFAAVVLAEIAVDDPAARPALEDALAHRVQQLRVLVADALLRAPQWTGPARGVLVEGLTSPDPLVRRQAVRSLQRIQPHDATLVTPLAEALTDADAQVRSLAAAALGAMGPLARSAVPRPTAARDTADAELAREMQQALRQIERPQSRRPRAD